MKTKKLVTGICVLCVLILAAVVIFFVISGNGGQQGAEPETMETAEDDAETSVEEPEVTEPEGEPETEPETAQPEETQTEGVRADTTVLQYMAEGNLEEMPATLYEGDGFSMYIPDEGWQIYEDEMVLPVKMSAIHSAEIGLWVEYHEENVSDTQTRLTAEGYVQNADSGRLEMQAGEILNEIRIFEGTDGTWLVCSRRPDTTEGAEGAAVLLEAITDTFAVTEKEGGAAQPAENAGLESAEAKALRGVMTAFYTAYFHGDEEGIRQYLSADFSGTPETYAAPETAGDIEIREIRGISDVPESDPSGECSLALEFVAPGEDSFTYLSAAFVKENGEWKISSYGLEK